MPKRLVLGCSGMGCCTYETYAKPGGGLLSKVLLQPATQLTYMAARPAARTLLATINNSMAGKAKAPVGQDNERH